MWAESWPTADVDAIDALYADDVVFYSHPFRDQQKPRDYVVWAFEDQAHAECRFGNPVVANDRAAVDWWAVLTSKDGSVESIAGITRPSLPKRSSEGRPGSVDQTSRCSRRASRLGEVVPLETRATLARP